MAKRNERKRIMARKAARAGYVTYRYGSATPVTLPRIFAGEKRKSLVSRVMDTLRDWRLSPFEGEGPTRAGLRSGLCENGHPWPLADNEAAALIEEGFRILGRSQRPSREEGQREFVYGREQCRYCGGALDRTDFINGRKFCSTDCAGRFLRSRDDDAGVRADAIRLHASYLVNTTKIPERDCEACGQRYQPTREGTRTCSRECAGKIRSDAVPDIECRNCFRVFHGQRGVVFCSIRCVHEYNRRTLPDRACEQCGNLFRPAKSFAKFCSKKCGIKAAYLRKREGLKREAEPSAFRCDEIKEAA